MVRESGRQIINKQKLWEHGNTGQFWKGTRETFNIEQAHLRPRQLHTKEILSLVSKVSLLFRYL